MSSSRRGGRTWGVYLGGEMGYNRDCKAVLDYFAILAEANRLRADPAASWAIGSILAIIIEGFML